MATLVLDVYSKDFPEISNRIRCSIYLETDLLAAVASIIDSAVNHPARIYHFPGLYRNNYNVRLDEIDDDGNVLSSLADFDAVPAQLDGLLVRDDEQIVAGVTPGFNVGGSTFVFDGTGGKPDYRGWSIVPSELNGRGILEKGVDYTWARSTGTFTLLILGDIFPAGQFYNIHFDPRAQSAGNSYPTLRDFKINLITSDTELDSTYFDGKLLVEPSSAYITIKLPSILTVVTGRPMMVEVSSDSQCCVAFETILGQTIKFLRGNLYGLPNESFWIYRYQRPDTSNEWRVSECDGNFKTVGQLVSDDFTQYDVFNKLLLDGSIVDKFQFARLYNEFVLNLPPEQVTDYDTWSVGNNKYLYSLANAADPGFINKFHVPDRRGITERNNNTGKAGDYNDDQTIDHKHEGTTGTLPISLNGVGATSKIHGTYFGTVFGKCDLTSLPTNADGTPMTKSGNEILVKNYLINKFVLC